VSETLKWLLPGLAVVLGLLGAAFIVATGPEAEVDPPEVALPLVRVIEATRGDVTLRVRTHGTVVPRTESDLVPEVAGRVVWVSPSLVAGGFFDEGAPLLRIERTDFEVAVEEARAHVARTESEAARAARDLERQQTLAEREVASPARLDDATNVARVTEAALRAARAGLVRAERDLARTEIRAPYRGRVREKRVDVGQFVTRGTPVARVYAVDYAEVRLPVADEQLAYLERSFLAAGALDGDGPEVRLTASFAGREHAWLGRIVRTEGELDPRSRMVHVVARIEAPYDTDVHGTGAPLAVGLFVEAEIRGLVVPDAVALPRAALRADGRILVVDADDRLRFRDVVVARIDREQVIVARGLAEGERVCVSHLAAVVDGMRVRPVVDDAPGGEGTP
jgi:RND family efflux transporter MFP subunit